MRKSEEIIYEHYGCKSWEEVCRDFLSDISPTMIKEIVKIAQIDAIEETVKRCARDSEITLKRIWEGIDSGYVNKVIIDEQSLIDIAEQLKKELE